MNTPSSYTIRRHGRNYRARDLATIRRWISEGRVVASDLIYDDSQKSWQTLRTWPILKDAFLNATDKPRPSVSPPTVYWVHRDGESFAADGLKTLMKWAKMGKIGPDDQIMHPALNAWFQATESPALLEAMPVAVRQGKVAVLPIVLDPFVGRDDDVVAHVTTQAGFSRSQKDGQASLTRTQSMGVVTPAETSSPVVSASLSAESEAEDSPCPPPIGEKGSRSVVRTQKMGTLEPNEMSAVSVDNHPAAGESKSVVSTQTMGTLKPGQCSAVPLETAPVDADSKSVVSTQTMGTLKPGPAPATADDEPPIASEVMSVVRTQTLGTLDQAGMGPASVAVSDQSGSAENTTSAPVNKTLEMRSVVGDGKTPGSDLVYHCARLFLVVRDLRPGEFIEGSSPHPLSGIELQNQPKLAAFLAMRDAFNAIVERGDARLAPACRRVLNILKNCERIIGVSSAQRLVIGNRGRPNMTSDEHALMGEFEEALRAVIALV